MTSVEFKILFKCWAVYQNPSDYPGKFVARCWLADNVTYGRPIVCGNLEEIQNVLRLCGLDRLGRFENDDPVIVETWI